MNLRNDNPHRIYKDGQVIPAGGYFDGDDADAARAGVTKVSDTEAESARTGEVPVEGSEQDRADALADLRGLAALAGTANGRDVIDEEGHRIPGSGLTRNPNEPSAPSPVSSPAHDPAVAGAEAPVGLRDSSAPEVGAQVAETLSNAGEAITHQDPDAHGDPQDRGEAPHGTDASNVTTDGEAPAERVEDEDDDDEFDVDSATKAELQAEAKRRDVEFKAKDTVADLRSKLKA